MSASPKNTSTIVSTGIDWLTASARRSERWKELRELGYQIVESEAALGNDTRRLHAQGYVGWSSGGASYGVRGDGAFLQMRSDVARERWHEAMPFASNVSRIDVQHTLELEPADPIFVKRQFQRAQKARAKRGRSAALCLIDGLERGRTLNIGRRTSDRYGRVYDKGLESKCAPAGKLIRFELEVKGKQSMPLAIRLADDHQNALAYYATCAGYFRSHAVEHGSMKIKRLESARVGATSNNDRRRVYMSAVVHSMLLRLAACGRMEDALGALGLVFDAEGRLVGLQDKERTGFAWRSTMYTK